MMSDREADLLGIDEMKYDAHGLIPAVVQDAANGDVLMVAYMNRESLIETIETGKTWFWSRSRKKYWMKGESGAHPGSPRAALRLRRRLPVGEGHPARPGGVPHQRAFLLLPAALSARRVGGEGRCR